MASTFEKLTRQLAKPLDWIDWQPELRDRAINLGIWSFFDPDQDAVLGPEPKPPSRDEYNEAANLQRMAYNLPPRVGYRVIKPAEDPKNSTAAGAPARRPRTSADQEVASRAASTGTPAPAGMTLDSPDAEYAGKVAVYLMKEFSLNLQLY